MGRVHLLDWLIVSRRRGRDVVADGVEQLHEIDRGLVPAEGAPQDLLLPRVSFESREVFSAQIEPLSVLQAGDIPPGSLPPDVPLRFGHADLWWPLLQLCGLAVREARGVDQFRRQFQISVHGEAILLALKTEHG